MERNAVSATLVVALLIVTVYPTPSNAEAENVPKLVREVCVACHGIDGNGAQPVHPEYPKLAGKQSAYLKKQLRDYRSGNRKSVVMTDVAAKLAPEDIEAVSVHYATQKPTPGVVKNPGLLELGKKIYVDGNPDNGVPACAGCHLPDAKGNMRYPHLAGQHMEYTYAELKKFGSSERENDRGLVMQSVALRMTDQEMKAVSEYIASLQ